MSAAMSLRRWSRCSAKTSSGQCRSRMNDCSASSFHSMSSDVVQPCLRAWRHTAARYTHTHVHARTTRSSNAVRKNVTLECPETLKISRIEAINHIDTCRTKCWSQKKIHHWNVSETNRWYVYLDSSVVNIIFKSTRGVKNCTHESDIQLTVWVSRKIKSQDYISIRVYIKYPCFSYQQMQCHNVQSTRRTHCTKQSSVDFFRFIHLYSAFETLFYKLNGHLKCFSATSLHHVKVQADLFQFSW